jgi:hypothetical protein
MRSRFPRVQCNRLFFLRWLVDEEVIRAGIEDVRNLRSHKHDCPNDNPRNQILTPTLTPTSWDGTGHSRTIGKGKYH